MTNLGDTSTTDDRLGRLLALNEALSRRVGLLLVRVQEAEARAEFLDECLKDCARSERDARLRVQEAERALREKSDALDAYASQYPCPGLGLDDGNASGCNGSFGDCPTCAAVLGGDVQEQEPLLMVSPLAAHAMQKYCGGEFFEAHVDGGPDFRFGGLAVKVMRDWNDWTPGG